MPDEHEPPTAEEMEGLLAALLQVDPLGIGGKHDAKRAKPADASET